MWLTVADALTDALRADISATTGAMLRREAETRALMTSWYTDPRDVRASRRYGCDISASAYQNEDRNGISVGIIRDVMRGRRGRGVALNKRGTLTRYVPANDRAAIERAIAGTVMMGNVD